MITEITCHALGALSINDTQDALVIDIGGQDTKIIRIEEGIQEIGSYAFYNVSSVNKLILPDTISCIGYYAFINCKAEYTLVNAVGFKNQDNKISSMFNWDYFINSNIYEEMHFPNAVYARITSRVRTKDCQRYSRGQG